MSLCYRVVLSVLCGVFTQVLHLQRRSRRFSPDVSLFCDSEEVPQPFYALSGNTCFTEWF